MQHLVSNSLKQLLNNLETNLPVYKVVSNYVGKDFVN